MDERDTSPGFGSRPEAGDPVHTVLDVRPPPLQAGSPRRGLPEGLHFHSLRHTCAAFLIADGRHMEEVKDHLGHCSIRVTSDTYGHLFPKARQAVADGLDETYRRAAATPPATEMRPTDLLVQFPNAHQGPGKGP